MSSTARTIGHYGLEGVTNTFSGDISIPGQEFKFEGSNGKNNGDYVASGTISGAGGKITVVGNLDNGKVYLLGTNTYTGLTEVQGGALQLVLGNGGTSGSLGTGNVNMSGNNSWLVFNRSDDGLVIPGNIYGAGEIRQAGTGMTTLTGANSYGDTDINAGTLQIGNGGTSGTLGVGTINVDFGSTLLLNRSDGASQTGDINFGQSDVNYTNTMRAVAGTWEINGDGGGIDIKGRVEWLADSGATLNINENGNNIGVLNGFVLVLGGDGDGSIDRYIASVAGNGTVYKEGPGTWSLNKENAISEGWDMGGLVINAGTLQIGADNAIPWGPARADVTIAAGATLDLNGNSQNFNHVFGSGGYITNSAGGSMTIGLGAGKTDPTISGVTIDEGTGTIAISKTGAGTATIESDCDLSGVAGLTTISAGKLVIEPAGAAGLSGAVTVSAGATLGGEGRAAGNLTFAGDASVSVDASVAATAFSTDGNIDLGGNTITVVLDVPPGEGITTFNILNYGGSLQNGDTNSFVLADAGNYRAATFGDTGSAITLNVLNTSHGWKGNINDDWDVNGTLNWTSPDEKFFDGDTISFTNVGAGPVVLTENVAPAGTTFDASSDYTLSGAFTINSGGGIRVTNSGNVTISSVIDGVTAITHEGAGTLTLNGANTFSGGVTVKSNATVKAGDDQAFGAGTQTTALTIENGGRLDINGKRFDNVYDHASITVSGAASKRAARRIGLSIANSPLVKTAVAGSDANWGRIVAAVGKAGEKADRDKLAISIGGVAVARDGGVVPGYDEAPVVRHMKGREIDIAVDVGVGRGRATVWTCDLTHEYISINADYRS